MSEQEKLRECPRMSEDDIKDTAEGLVKGRIFAASSAPPELWTAVFPIIALGGLSDIDPTTVGDIIEDISKAGPRSVNGYPVFFSCRVVHKDDWAAILERAARAQEALDAALKGDHT